jgi:hypothetical protein
VQVRREAVVRARREVVVRARVVDEREVRAVGEHREPRPDVDDVEDERGLGAPRGGGRDEASGRKPTSAVGQALCEDARGSIAGHEPKLMPGAAA